MTPEQELNLYLERFNNGLAADDPAQFIPAVFDIDALGDSLNKELLDDKNVWLPLMDFYSKKATSLDSFFETVDKIDQALAELKEEGFTEQPCGLISALDAICEQGTVPFIAEFMRRGEKYTHILEKLLERDGFNDGELVSIYEGLISESVIEPGDLETIKNFRIFADGNSSDISYFKSVECQAPEFPFNEAVYELSEGNIEEAVEIISAQKRPFVDTCLDYANFILKDSKEDYFLFLKYANEIEYDPRLQVAKDEVFKVYESKDPQDVSIPNFASPSLALAIIKGSPNPVRTTIDYCSRLEDTTKALHILTDAYRQFKDPALSGMIEQINTRFDDN